MTAFLLNNKNKIAKTLTVVLFPLLGCILYCCLRGTSFFKLFLPSSYNNDVLFYYKLVEGLVNGGITGYFGFNESHALYGGFAAWNPMIIVPWFIWGIIFGWGYMSPIACNIFLFSIAMGIYVLLVNPKWKSIGVTLLMYLLFPSLWIHLMNSLPETIITANLIVFTALMINYSDSKKNVCLYLAIVLAMYLTVVRPYMVTFLVYALVNLAMQKRRINYMVVILVCIVTGFASFLSGHYFSAEYFEPLYDMHFIKALFGGHIKQAYHILGSALKNMVPEILRFIGGAFSFGSTAGTQYFICLTGIGFSIAWLITARKKKDAYKGVYASYAIAGTSLFAAIIVLLGKANEGGRHCYAFAILAILLLSLTVDTLGGMILNVTLTVLLATFIFRGAMVPTDYDIPMPNDKLAEELEYWESVFVQDGSVGYDNTIIWALTDTVDGNGIITDYHGLYAAPAKAGINCCDYLYLFDNIDSLKSKYIGVASGGYWEEELMKLGYGELGRNEKFAIYVRK